MTPSFNFVENGIKEDKDETKNPLVLYEKSLQTNGKEIDDDELLYLRRQVKFCSQWCLDNLCKEYILSFYTRISE